MLQNHKNNRPAWLFLRDMLVQERSFSVEVRDNPRKLLYLNTQLPLIHKKQRILIFLQTSMDKTNTWFFVKRAKYKPKPDSVSYNMERAKQRTSFFF